MKSIEALAKLIEFCKRLYVIFAKDISAVTIRLADEVNLAALIAGATEERGKRVGLKPNLVIAKPASSGAITHFEIAETSG